MLQDVTCWRGLFHTRIEFYVFCFSPAPAANAAGPDFGGLVNKVRAAHVVSFSFWCSTQASHAAMAWPPAAATAQAATLRRLRLESTRRLVRSRMLQRAVLAASCRVTPSRLSAAPSRYSASLWSRHASTAGCQQIQQAGECSVGTHAGVPRYATTMPLVTLQVEVIQNHTVPSGCAALTDLHIMPLSGVSQLNMACSLLR